MSMWDQISQWLSMQGSAFNPPGYQAPGAQSGPYQDVGPGLPPGHSQGLPIEFQRTPQFGGPYQPPPPPGPPLPQSIGESQPPMTAGMPHPGVHDPTGGAQLQIPPPMQTPEQQLDSMYPGPYGEAAMMKDAFGEYPYETEARQAEEARLAAQPSPTETWLNAYDQRTDEMVGGMEEADRKNKYLEMAAGIFDAGIGNYTGAMGNVFRTQSEYNRRPAGYEGMRAERDSSKIDDLYKMMQTRKAAQGTFPSKFEMQIRSAETQEDIDRILEANPQLEYERYSDGVGGFWRDKGTGNVYGDDGQPYNVTGPGGMKKFRSGEARARAADPANRKEAKQEIQNQRMSEAWSKLVGGDRTILAILDQLPAASHEEVMRRALDNVVIQMGGSGDVDTSGASSEYLMSQIEIFMRENPGQRDAVMAAIRQGMMPE